MGSLDRGEVVVLWLVAGDIGVFETHTKLTFLSLYECARVEGEA